MIDKEIEGFFIEDEKKYKQEDIIRLISKLKQYAKLVGKEGRVHIEDKSLSGTDRSKVFLIARYLGSELSKLKPELGIKRDIALVTTQEFAEFLSKDEPNARARISQLVDEGFAKRPAKGSVQVEPFQIERFLGELEKQENEITIRSKNKKSQAMKKTKATTKKEEPKSFKIEEKIFFDNLSRFLSINEEKLKDLIYVRNNGSFKFHNMPGKTKTEKQKKCILCSGFLYLFGLQKRTFQSREVSDICFHSSIDPNGIKDTIKYMKGIGLINKAEKHSQENILSTKGKEEAKKILQDLCK